MRCIRPIISRPTHLHQLVQQHFVIFKIGPCLTRCLHQTLFALADIEDRWAAATIKSHLRQVMETVMLDAPEHWQTHYRGDPASQKELREKSLRDRIRYYWNAPEAVRAVAVMLNNLDRPLPGEAGAPLLCGYYRRTGRKRYAGRARADPATSATRTRTLLCRLWGGLREVTPWKQKKNRISWASGQVPGPEATRICCCSMR